MLSNLIYVIVQNPSEFYSNFSDFGFSFADAHGDHKGKKDDWRTRIGFGEPKDNLQLINTLYYSDSPHATRASETQEAAFSIDTEKKSWLQDAFSDFLPAHAFAKSSESKSTSEAQAVPMGPKVYLLKLIEFNKIELLE